MCSKESPCHHTKHFHVCNSKSAGSNQSCPQNYPYVYYNGNYCCTYDTENVDTPDGELCDGGPIGVDSLCCKNQSFQMCANSPCSNYEREGFK